MAKKKLFKSKTNFTIRRLHQSGNYGNIYERDYTTIVKSLSNPGGQIPYGSTPTFKLTIRNGVNDRKKYNYGNWIINPTNCSRNNMWTLGCMPEPNKEDSKIIPKLQKNRLTDFVCYGSSSELIRATLTDIVSKFPAELYVSDNSLSELGVFELGYISNTTELIKNKDKYINMYEVKNPMYIDIIQSVIPEDSQVSKIRYMCESQNKYNIIDEKDNIVVRGEDFNLSNVTGSTGTNGITSGNTGTITKGFIGEQSNKKIWEVIHGEDKDCLETGDLLAEVNFKNTFGNTVISIYCFFYEGDIMYVSDKKGYRIRPNNEVINDFFKNLDDFEKVILNQYTKYTANFETYLEDDEDGWIMKNESYRWPLDEGGWNLLLSGISYADYMNKLVKLAYGYDTLYTDAIWRNMVHESMGNLDSTKLMGDDDIAINSSKMRKFLNVVGRQFDEIKKYIDNIKNTNNVSYGQENNSPDYFLPDMLELAGWDTKEILNDISGDVITEPMYGSRTLGFSVGDANNEFMRRLLLNSKNIISSKGTKRCIEDLMGVFGYHSTDWLRKYYNKLEDKHLRKAFIINEYVYVANGYDNDVDPDKIADRVKYINSLKTNFNIDNIEDPEQSFDDYQGLPVIEVAFDDKVRIVPWFDKNKEYDDELYFQMKGGWSRNDGDEENPQNIYDYTISNIYFTHTKEDLYNILPYQINDMGVYYVNDIKTYYKRVLEFDSMQEEGWEELSEDEILQIENIVDYNKGNNPHTGNYDGGETYKECFKKIFKNSIFENVNSIDVNDRYDYGFKLVKYRDSTKCQFFNDTSNSEKRLTTLRVRDEVKPYDFFAGKISKDDNTDYMKYTEISSLSIFNTKELNITFDSSQRDFIEKDILPYLKQIIPATTIFSYNFKHLLSDDDLAYKANPGNTVCDNNSCPISGVEDK